MFRCGVDAMNADLVALCIARHRERLTAPNAGASERSLFRMSALVGLQRGGIGEYLFTLAANRTFGLDRVKDPSLGLTL